VVFNIVLFFALPPYLAKNPNSFILNFIPAKPDYGYILLAIMLSGVVAMLLFLPRLLKTSLKFSGSLWKKLMAYSLPLMVAGLPGVANDFIDRPLFRFFAPSSAPWQDQLGVYNAVMKLAVFMVLFVQMFRYAAEPFFFASAEKKDIRKTYADVMKYFVAFCILIFLGIVLYADIFALILGKDYRSGMGVLPIVLIANILLGVTFNLSMWYKLTDHTRFAIYITLAGLVVTTLLNVIFMPVYGYFASAWSRFFSYVVMIVISYWLGTKYYPIPYDVKSIMLYFVVGTGLFGLSLLLKGQSTWLRLSVNTVLLLIYVVFVLKTEKIRLNNLKALIPVNILKKNRNADKSR
jgi:O-antigen/teichoic acid export membrane protein